MLLSEWRGQKIIKSGPVIGYNGAKKKCVSVCLRRRGRGGRKEEDNKKWWWKKEVCPSGIFFCVCVWKRASLCLWKISSPPATPATTAKKKYCVDQGLGACAVVARMKGGRKPHYLSQ